MSASHRKISRLPLPVFQDLITRPPLEGRDDDPKRLKFTICNRLKRFVVRTGSRNKKRTGGGMSSTTTCSIKTIGQLLRLSKSILLVVLDPILTYEEISIFLSRICNQCSPKPNTVLRLLQGTNAAVNKYYNNDGSCCEQNAAQQYQEFQKSITEYPSKHQQTDPITFGISMRDIPTSLPSLDRILCGGVRLATVTELVGRSGTGKTQLAFQLCIAAAKLNQGAIYIDTEKKLSLPRLREMSEQWRAHGLREQRRRRELNIVTGGVGTGHSRQLANKATRFSYNQGYGNSSPTPNSQQTFYSEDCYDHKCEDEDAIGTFKSAEFVLGNLTVHQPGSSGELLDVMDALEDEILQRNQIAGQAFSTSTIGVEKNTRNIRGKYPVRLLIVDSIASPMRRDFGTDSAPQRASAIFQFAQKINRLADQLHLAAVVINQVGGSDGNMLDRSHDIGSNNSKIHSVAVRAALGTSWYHCVSTRIMLEISSPEAKVGSDHCHEYEFGTNFELKNNTNSPGPMQQAHRVARKVAVVKSNKIGFSEAGFEITTLGIVENSSHK